MKVNSPICKGWLSVELINWLLLLPSIPYVPHLKFWCWKPLFETLTRHHGTSGSILVLFCKTLCNSPHTNSNNYINNKRASCSILISHLFCSDQLYISLLSCLFVFWYNLCFFFLHSQSCTVSPYWHHMLFSLRFCSVNCIVCRLCFLPYCDLFVFMQLKQLHP